MESLELLGVWWIPAQQPNAIAGILTFSHQEGFNLNLIGMFKPVQALPLVQTQPIILGVTQEGKAVTLQDCVEVNTQLNFGGSFSFSKQQFKAQSAYIGTHFAYPQEVRFYKVALQYSYLPAWAKLPWLQEQVIPNESGKLGKHEFAYTPPPEVMATTAKGTITVTSTFHTTNDLLQEVNLRHSVWLEIETQEELALENWLAQFINPFQNLLNLGTHRPNSIRTIHAYSKQHNITRPDGSIRENPIQVLFQQYYYENEPSEKLREHEMLFTLQDIIHDFSQVIEKWLRIADDLDSVCNLFFGIQYNERLYLEQRFLNIIQAVESYHRRRSDKQDLPEEKHQQRIEAILAGTPQEYKKWLTDKLKYSNELNLRKRLKDLLDSNSVNKVILPLVRKKNAFVDKVVNTRNFFTHYDPSLERGVARGVELYRLTQILALLLEACFLNELGFSSQQSVELFQKNSDYLNVLGQTQIPT